MSIGARRFADAVAFAAAQGLTDTRKGTGVAWTAVRGTYTLNGSSQATLSNSSFNANTIVDYYLTTFAGTALAVNYKQTATAGQVVIQGVTGAGANATTDQSTFSYVAFTPCFHADQTTLTQPVDPWFPTATNLSITATNAVDLPTSIALANQMRFAYIAHIADAVAHVAADTTNTLSTAVAVDLASTITLLNAIKAAFNLHIAVAASHVFADNLNNVATANASDLPTSQTLANALKTALNAHLGSAATGEGVTILNP